MSQEVLLKVEGLSGDHNTLEICPGPDTYSSMDDRIIRVAVAPSEIGVERFIVDTGCGYNLVQHSLVQDGGRGDALVLLNTAAGVT
eukprot:10481666-Prorocentrum_lima.AAC.1